MSQLHDAALFCGKSCLDNEKFFPLIAKRMLVIGKNMKNVSMQFS